jgi:hypothetical protein
MPEKVPRTSQLFAGLAAGNKQSLERTHFWGCFSVFKVCVGAKNIGHWLKKLPQLGSFRPASQSALTNARQNSESQNPRVLRMVTEDSSDRSQA